MSKETAVVTLVSRTENADSQIAYMARVSNPGNQYNSDTAPRLIAYCIKKGHWSIFEMANMCVEIQTSRAISAQILRHKSFSFQEFSQRYAEVQSFEHVTPRRQDDKNRQNSFDDLPLEDKAWFRDVHDQTCREAIVNYKEALSRGIAKESARFLLPMSATTKLYMNGNIRSWIHYLKLRIGPETQKEHRDIALAILEIFKTVVPTVYEAVFGNDDFVGIN